jgi:Methyltransferase FkbM domain
MTRRWVRLIAAGLIAVVVILVVRNQVKVYRGRQARAARARVELADYQRLAAFREQRRGLLETLKPVALANCTLQRFGEVHDGGYLMCGNLLGSVKSGYSYGISGYDKWGCDISTQFKVTVHQYDCFNTTQPACPEGRTVFHAECVGDRQTSIEGRPFDTVANQLARNGDRARRVVLKMDVEGAEWDSFLSAPNDVYERIDQMAVEFHWLRDETGWVQTEKYLRVVLRLKQFFEIAHIHFNNYGCLTDLEPFPAWAYEVLFVNKRLAVVDPSGKAGGLHPLDAPNSPALADCQPKGASPTSY